MHQDIKRDIHLKLSIKELETLTYILRDKERYQYINEEDIIKELEEQLKHYSDR